MDDRKVDYSDSKPSSAKKCINRLLSTEQLNFNSLEVYGKTNMNVICFSYRPNQRTNIEIARSGGLPLRV